MKLRLTIGMLAVLPMLPAAAAAQDEAYTLGELEQRCEDNTPDEDLRDACLFVVSVYLAPGPAAQGLTSVAAGSDAPVTRTGGGFAQTAPFELSGGDYRIEVTATSNALTGCFHGGPLMATDGSVREEGGDVRPGIGATVTSETYVYGLPTGRYYFDMVSGCDAWSVTIEPY
jgi:hypothetical protein